MLKTLHVTFAALSISGFCWRGALMLRDSPLLHARFVRVAPHVIDTLLLVTAVLLALRLHQYPLVHGWLTAKVTALVAYIVLGAVGLRYGATKRIRLAAFVAALIVFAYIVGVALTRQPFLGWS